MRFRGVVLLLLVTPPLAAQPATVAAPDWDAQLASVHALARAGQPALALGRLQELLRRHGPDPELRLRKGEILLLHEQCAFLAGTKPPELRELVAGDLRQFDEQTGRVVWRWNVEQLADWELDPEVASPPVVFRGPHTLRVREPTPLSAGVPVELRICARGERAHVLSFRPTMRRGRLTLHAITAARVAGSDRTTLATVAEASCGDGLQPELTVTVLAHEIRLTSPRGEILRVPKPRDEWGRIELHGLRFERFEVAGEIEPSWLQNRRDAAREQQRLAFLRTYDPHATLPRWLFDVPPRPGDAPEAAAAAARAYPDPLGAAALALTEELETSLTRGRAAQVLQQLSRLGPEEIPAATAAWLRAQALLQRGEPAAAMAALEAAPATGTAHDSVLALRAQILAAQEQRAEARQCLRELQRRHPGDPEPRLALAQLCLEERDVEAAHRLLAAARAEGATSRELLATERMLQLALSGPGWPRSSVQTSASFELHSDLDGEVCREALAVLEDALRLFQSHLPGARAPRGGRFTVYLFSGEQGYLQHLRGMLGPGVAAHTHGVYLRRLGQILVWNLPTRSQLLHTIRHEGLHQYVGDRIADPPRWLDEGLAEYFEQAERNGGQWQTGVPRRDHLATLANHPDRPLLDLLQADDARFFADAQAGYAHAWAFVHLLLHSSARNRALFDALWEALAAGARAPAAIERVLLPEVERLQQELAAHVQGLRG